MSGQSRIPVALVGCGRIAQVHQQYLVSVPEAELVAVCDEAKGPRTSMSARAAVPGYATMNELMRYAAPRVVHIMSPPATHAALALRALDAGAHVFIEKPMTLSVAEADAVVTTARQLGLIATADHNRWFDPVVQRARALIDRGDVGTLVGVDVFQSVGSGGDGVQPQAWKTSLPGGPIHDIAPHPVYFLRHFLGPLDAVEVSSQRDADGRVDEARLLARGEKGMGTVTLSMRTRPAVNWVRLFGSKATIEINLNHLTLLRYHEHRGAKLVGKVLPNVDVSWQLLRETARNGIDFVRGRQRFYPGVGAHLREFYRCLARGLPPPVSAEEARDVVAICEQILTSGRAAQEEKAVGT